MPSNPIKHWWYKNPEAFQNRRSTGDVSSPASLTFAKVINSPQYVWVDGVDNDETLPRKLGPKSLKG